MKWDTVQADSIKTSKRSDDWCNRLFYNADIETLAAATLNCGLEKDRQYDWSIPIWNAKNATTTRKIFLDPAYSGSFRVPLGTRIPWNPKWKPSGGTDHHMVIIDEANKVEWDFWGFSTNGSIGPMFNYPNIKAGYAPHVYATAGTAVKVDYLTTGNGAGFVVGPLSCGVLLPSEIAQGYIPHALKLVVSSSCSMVGPEAPEGLEISDPMIGTKYGIAVSPCSLFESRHLRGDLTKMVPDGSRFQLVISDTEIGRRISQLNLSVAEQAIARIIAKCLCNFGFFIGHTSKQRASFVGDGSDPKAWRNVGFVGDGSNLLKGLVRSPDDLRCLEPPISFAGVRATSRYVEAEDILYTSLD